jgi:hypothetical protein
LCNLNYEVEEKFWNRANEQVTGSRNCELESIIFGGVTQVPESIEVSTQNPNPRPPSQESLVVKRFYQEHMRRIFEDGPGTFARLNDRR